MEIIVGDADPCDDSQNNRVAFTRYMFGTSLMITEAENLLNEFFKKIIDINCFMIKKIFPYQNIPIILLPTLFNKVDKYLQYRPTAIFLGHITVVIHNSSLDVILDFLFSTP